MGVWPGINLELGYSRETQALWVENIRTTLARRIRNFEFKCGICGAYAETNIHWRGGAYLGRE